LVVGGRSATLGSQQGFKKCGLVPTLVIESVRIEETPVWLPWWTGEKRKNAGMAVGTMVE
jgi:hypothetical protein